MPASASSGIPTAAIAESSSLCATPSSTSFAPSRLGGNHPHRQDAKTASVKPHLKSHRSHQLQRIALAHDPRTHHVVEYDPSVFEMVLEMYICGARREGLGNFRQCQVMSREKSHRASIHETSHDCFGSNSAVM